MHCLFYIIKCSCTFFTFRYVTKTAMLFLYSSFKEVEGYIYLPKIAINNRYIWTMKYHLMSTRYEKIYFGKIKGKMLHFNLSTAVLKKFNCVMKEIVNNILVQFRPPLLVKCHHENKQFD